MMILLLTVRVRVFSALLAGNPGSEARMVNVDVPATIGVPLITPVPVFRVNPAGRTPVGMNHS
jgi:hypothetical protein